MFAKGWEIQVRLVHKNFVLKYTYIFFFTSILSSYFSKKMCKKINVFYSLKVLSAILSTMFLFYMGRILHRVFWYLVELHMKRSQWMTENLVFLAIANRSYIDSQEILMWALSAHTHTAAAFYKCLSYEMCSTGFLYLKVRSATSICSFAHDLLTFSSVQPEYAAISSTTISRRAVQIKCTQKISS